MTEKVDTQVTEEEGRVYTIEEFLESVPPGQMAKVSSAAIAMHNNYFRLNTSNIKLYCPHEDCESEMTFVCKESLDYIEIEKYSNGYIQYACRHCGVTKKLFSVHVELLKGNMADVYKYGELPNFGPPTPTRLLRLLDKDRAEFLSGRRCESQGLGIGALTYYRRVLENQWKRLVSEVIRVAKGIDADAEVINTLERSLSQNQFAQAVDAIKDAIPPALKINGKNPLTLLHSALSLGVHGLSDDECLELATSIRIVLFEFSEKMGAALKDQKELSSAVARLAQARSIKAEKDKTTELGKS